MWRSEDEASPLNATLVGSEDHLPVVSFIRMFRKKNKPPTQAPRVVRNLQALKSKRKSSKFLLERDEKLSAFTDQAQDSQDEKFDYSSLSAEEEVDLLVNIIRRSAQKPVRKKCCISPVLPFQIREEGAKIAKIFENIHKKIQEGD